MPVWCAAEAWMLAGSIERPKSHIPKITSTMMTSATSSARDVLGSICGCRFIPDK